MSKTENNLVISATEKLKHFSRRKETKFLIPRNIKSYNKVTLNIRHSINKVTITPYIVLMQHAEQNPYNLTSRFGIMPCLANSSNVAMKESKLSI